MRRWILLLGLALVVVGAAAGVTTFGRRSPSPASEVGPAVVPVEVARVEVGSVARTVEVSGSVTAARLAELFPRISGRVARVLVTDGDRVAAGQALVELDAADQRAEVAQAEAGAAAAAARLAQLEAGPRPEERQVVFNAVTQAQSQVKVAETQVALTQAALRVAEDHLRRQEQLLREGAIAQAQVDQARLQYDQAKAQFQAAQTQFEIAKTALDSARQQWAMVERGARAEELQAARAQLAQARAVVALARQRLANMTIRAPFAGRVAGLQATVGDYLTSGDFAARGSPVVKVYDDRAMEVEVLVGERDLPLIRVGQPALIRLEGDPGKPVDATVSVISPVADPASRASSVRLRLQAPPPAAVPGVFARGEIIVERRTGVPLVPKAAVVGGERPFVRVVVKDTVRVRPVVLGLSQGDRVEVLAGVDPGEMVVVLGPEVLPPETRVRVVTP
ncbi:MAG: efflux RND transporter periplasmic adaptor subunit [Armatimonadota bacterium]|nr:efflux RND transporter periplasmic adaptor subunit [Armatimonadota bacterium]MDR7550309.1 efflux RND transporter periplasmic adaptor subunit [Armatimonadota bacterium]